MTYAAKAAGYINAWCVLKFPNAETQVPPHAVGASMATTMANGGMVDCFDHEGGGSHKYIPVEDLNGQLGLPDGGGVFGYWKMKDGSYLLRTCQGPLAHWDGAASTVGCAWGEFSGMKGEG